MLYLLASLGSLISTGSPLIFICPSSADVDEKTGDPSGISFDNLTVNFE